MKTLCRLMALICLVSLIGLYFSGCESSKKTKLHLYIWSSYIKPELIERFEKEYNCRVIIDTYDSNESMYAKFRAGAAGYDLVMPSNYIIDLMINQGLLQPLDFSLIPNVQYLDPTYTKYVGQETIHYGVPYMVSLTGLGYRKDRVEMTDASWGVFGEERWRGRMTMLNDLREVLGVALRYLGYSANTTNADQINEAADLVIGWKRNLAKFESEQYKNGIANAEYLIVQGYNGDILQVIQENEQVGFVYPKEGAIFSIDYMVIPRNAPHPNLAHAFIDYMQRPAIAAENMEYTFFLSPNKEAYTKLDESLKKNPILFPPQEVLDKLEPIRNLGEHSRLYNRAWDKIKAG